MYHVLLILCIESFKLPQFIRQNTYQPKEHACFMDINLHCYAHIATRPLL